jgi:hypothetical protein
MDCAAVSPASHKLIAKCFQRGQVEYTLIATDLAKGCNVSAFGAEQCGIPVSDTGHDLRLDNVTYSLAPEPGSPSLLAFAGFGLLRRRRA